MPFPPSSPRPTSSTKPGSSLTLWCLMEIIASALHDIGAVGRVGSGMGGGGQLFSTELKLTFIK